MDWLNPVSSTVSGAFGLLGNYLQYKYNTRLAEQQNKYNLEMWNLQNEYNSPQAQMKRFEEAGLNPNLIYGQGNPGNASSSPQMVTPDAPHLSKDMRDLAQAFNIEGLKVAIANRQKAQQEARLAKAHADDAESNNEALERLYWNYHFNRANGAFEFDGGVDSQNGNDFTLKPIYPGVVSQAQAKMMKLLSDNYRTNSLLVPRAALIGSQRLYNEERQKLLAPQVGMMQYSAKYFPYTFWLGNTRTGAQIVSPFIP